MDYLDRFLNKHVTVILPATNQPISVESSTSLFSGVLKAYTDRDILLGLYDGTQAVFSREWLVGIIENKTVDSPLDKE